MFNRPFNYILNTPAKVAVLRVLSGVMTPLTGRAIEQLGNLAHAACLRALHDLSIAKVVTFKQYGREKLYELNRKNKEFTEGITRLFRSEDLRQRAFFTCLRNWISSKKSQVVQSSIYGSVARHEDRLGSDVDLLLIVNTVREKERLLEAWLEMEPEISEKFSVTVSPYFLTLKDFLERYKARDPVIQSAVQEGYSLTDRTLKELVYAKIKH